MSDKKILFFDIDGTLITNDSRRIFPENTKQALKEARSNGHLLFINTGRSLCNVDDFILEAGFDGLVLGCGTQIMYQGNELFHHELNHDFCVEVAEQCRKFRFSAIFEYPTHTGFDMDFNMEGRNEILEYFKGMGRALIDDIYSEDFRFDKFAAWYDEKSDVSGFREYITRYFQYIEREGNFCEVVPKGFTKASGIQFLLDYFQIPLHNAYVFGDSNNDLEMMQFVEHSIAMKNCTDEVRRTASYITDDVMEGGISKAMKHFGLIG